METLKPGLAAIALLITNMQPGLAQDADSAALLREIQGNRRTVIAENMVLTVDETKRFWPLYDEFRAALGVLDEQQLQLIREFRDNFDDLSGEQADAMLTRFFDLRSQELALRQEYQPRFREFLSAQKTLRYFQVENKLDTIIDYDVSQLIPLTETE